MTLYMYTLLIGLLPMAINPGRDSNAAGYTITGQFKGNAEGKKVYLRAADDRKPLDSTVIQNGGFVFKGTTDFPKLYYITISKNEPTAKSPRPFQPLIPLFLENTAVSVSGILDSLPTELGMYTGQFNTSHIKVAGSPQHAAYTSYSNGYSALSKKRGEAFDKYIAYLNPGKDKKKGPVSEGIAAIEKIDVAKKAMTDYISDYVRRNNDSYVAVYALRSGLESFSVREAAALEAGLSDRIRNSPAGRSFNDHLGKIKGSLTGSRFTDFSFEDKDGKPVKLSDHLGKGKYVLLEFWASWCGPCRADIPHLKDVFDLYHPAGFEVISVSMDESKEKWLKAVEEEQMKWLQVSDLKAFNGELSKVYNFNGIPTCLLISPAGEIVTRNMRGSWMDKKLIELYGNKFGDKF